MRVTIQENHINAYIGGVIHQQLHMEITRFICIHIKHVD